MFLFKASFSFLSVANTEIKWYNERIDAKVPKWGTGLLEVKAWRFFNR